MGINFGKAAVVAVETQARAYARNAADDGCRIYTPVIGKASHLAANIDTWGLAIEAIEAEGWMLTHWAIAPDGDARPVFRRVD